MEVVAFFIAELAPGAKPPSCRCPSDPVEDSRQKPDFALKGCLSQGTVDGFWAAIAAPEPKSLISDAPVHGGRSQPPGQRIGSRGVGRGAGASRADTHWATGRHPNDRRRSLSGARND